MSYESVQGFNPRIEEAGNVALNTLGSGGSGWEDEWTTKRGKMSAGVEVWNPQVEQVGDVVNATLGAQGTEKDDDWSSCPYGRGGTPQGLEMWGPQPATLAAAVLAFAEVTSA